LVIPAGQDPDPILGSLANWQSQPLTLVLGGARSGKSRLAEALTRRWAGEVTPVYIATAEALDDEMRDRIDQHRSDRGEDWVTVEAPMALPAALMRVRAEPVLVDCLTLWLSNLLVAGRPLEGPSDALMTALQERRAPTVLVANEVGLGIVPENALARRFRDAAGKLNQQIAAAADAVIFSAAGLPLVLKGPEPHSRKDTDA
jgi:adenosylcobinamide kinase / adenosylcobinamide-phosphate guanylyltransferase